MSLRTNVLVLCLLLVSGAWAQTPPADTPPAPAPTPAAARETPPDSKAYTEAGRITDPEKKIAAYEKFKKDFPTSSMVSNADMGILTTLAQKLPKQTARIRKLAAHIYKDAPGKNRGSVGNQIATQMFNAGILLSDARKYARKGVESMTLAPYLQEQLAGYEKRKQKGPEPQELAKRFYQNRATRVALLGRIEVKLGHTGRGQALLEEAYAANKENVTVQAALGELFAKAGQDEKALGLLIPARLAGSAGKDAAATLESVYRKSHNNSVEGLESMLDAEYHKRFPNPVKVEHYKPTEKRSDRVVLAEIFTGSGCPPCASADIAFDAAMERYSRKDLAVLMYHQHIPRPDPMTNPDSTARKDSYAVTGVPTFAIDGKKTVGGGSRDMAPQTYGKFNPDIEKNLESPAEAHITVGANLTGNRVSVHVKVNGVNSEAKDLKLQIALVEKEIRFNGENGIRFHPMVVRAMGGHKGQGFELDAAGGTFDQVFDIDEVSRAIKTHLDTYEAGGHRGEAFTFAEKKYQIDRNALALVVFVQEDKSKHVLQAGYLEFTEGPVQTAEAAGVR